MRKFTLIAALLVAYVFTANAQTDIAGNGDTNDKNFVSETTEAADYVTIGATMPFYAKPDPYFHPNYNDANAWALTAGFTWLWTVTPPTGPDTNPAAIGGKPVNYREIAFAALGDYTLKVKEKASAALGGCEGAEQSHTVTVIEAPTYTWNWGAFTYDNQCEGAVPVTKLELTLAANANDGNIRLAYNLQIKTQTWDGAAWVDSKFYNLAKDNDATPLAVNFPNTAPETKLAAGAKDLSAALAYDCISEGGKKVRTVYTYNVFGLNSQITRKSDFLSGPVAPETFGYRVNDGTVSADATAAAQTFWVAVNPAPVTGEIYHVKNAWSVDL
ncbi:MAG: hypothetical protein N4A72_22475 [Bacteroidales bacterium]|jgi:hypothetical protein|nr:hypothetical protein [Bacteroidales bacterium]